MPQKDTTAHPRSLAVQGTLVMVLGSEIELAVMKFQSPGAVL